DFHVTGVQTCALPICGVDARGVDASANRAHGVVVERWFRDLEEEWDAELWTHFGRSFEQAPLLRAVLTDPALGGVVAATECSRRSEERRVGRGRRSRG